MKWLIDIFVNLGFLYNKTLVADQLDRGQNDGGDAQFGQCCVEKPEKEAEGRKLPLDHVARYLWGLDAGHGIKTAGKRSPFVDFIIHILTPKRQLLEYEYNRDIIERIIEQLSALGLAYFRTMPVHSNYGNALEERVKTINTTKSDLPILGISVHGNAGPARSVNHYTERSVRGFETWCYHTSTKGRKMATVFQSHLMSCPFVAEVPATQPPIVNRGVRSRITKQFYILRATKFPVVLTENLFFNNKYDLDLMCREEIRQQIANAHVDAIIEIELNGI